MPQLLEVDTRPAGVRVKVRTGRPWWLHVEPPDGSPAEDYTGRTVQALLYPSWAALGDPDEQGTPLTIRWPRTPQGADNYAAGEFWVGQDATTAGGVAVLQIQALANTGPSIGSPLEDRAVIVVDVETSGVRQ